MWARLRVWRRGASGKAEPAELLPELYGGLYDRLAKRYVPDAEPERDQVVEFSCHPGQIGALLYREQKHRVLLLGGPGSGKTWVAELRQVLKGLGAADGSWGGPNRTWLHVGATDERVDVLWDQFHELVRALGWIEPFDFHEKKRLRLTNGSLHLFKGGRPARKSEGTKIQGVSAHGAVVDEVQNVSDAAQKDTAERGRRAGPAYEMTETATRVNRIGSFIRRLKKYKTSPDRVIITLNPLENPFVAPDYWDILRRESSDRDFRERVLSEDLPSEHLTYHAFNLEENCRRRPRKDDLDYIEITAELARQRWGGNSKRKFIVGHDFGQLTSASEWLKAYRHLPTGARHWWIVRETVSGSHTTTEAHAQKLAKECPPDEFSVSADPHVNTPDADKSDFAQMRGAGLDVHKAWSGKIHVRHRIAMLNALLCNSAKERRLFVDLDEAGEPVAPMFVDSCIEMERDEFGNPENVRKDYRDPSHYPAAASYGLFPWEHFAGAAVSQERDQPEDPLLAEAERYR